MSGWQRGAARPSTRVAAAELGEVGAKLPNVVGGASPRDGRRASAGTRRRPSHRTAGCSARRRARRGRGGSAGARGRSPGRPTRSLFGGWFGGAARRTGTGRATVPRRTAPASRPTGSPRAPAVRSIPAAARACQCRRVGWTARVADTGFDVVRGDIDRRPALQADGGIALAGDRAVVRVVQAAERLVVRREVALRVVRAPIEDVSGASCATRDERPVGVLRADDLERERIGRRRALTLDEVAIGVPRAADEGPNRPRRDTSVPSPHFGQVSPSPSSLGSSSPGSGRDSLCSGYIEHARNRPLRPSRMTIG